jgi:hypothetical protein
MTVFHEPNIQNTNFDYIKVLPKDLIDKILLFFAKYDEKKPFAPYVEELMDIQKQFKYYSPLLKVNLVGLESEGLDKTFPQAEGIHLDVLDETTNLPNLQRLRINSVGTDFAKNIVRFPAVTELRIDCLNGRAGEEYVGDDLWNIMPQLRTLHIRNRDFSWQLGNFAYLEELRLVECPSFTDDCFRGLSRLQRLYLRDVRNITDGAFKHMPNLTKLHLIGYINIGDAAIQCLPNLEILDISGVDGICKYTLTDKAFINSSNLEELQLPYVDEVYNYENCKLSFELFKYLPNLKRLYAIDTSLMNAELFQVLPPLDVLEIGNESDDLKPQNNMFSKLRVKKLVVDFSVTKYITQEDLDCMIANGLEKVSYILDSWAKKTFSSKNITEFLPWFRKHLHYESSSDEESGEESDEELPVVRPSSNCCTCNACQKGTIRKQLNCYTCNEHRLCTVRRCGLATCDSCM